MQIKLAIPFPRKFISNDTTGYNDNDNGGQQLLIASLHQVYVLYITALLTCGMQYINFHLKIIFAKCLWDCHPCGPYLCLLARFGLFYMLMIIWKDFFFKSFKFYHISRCLKLYKLGKHFTKLVDHQYYQEALKDAPA